MSIDEIIIHYFLASFPPVISLNQLTRGRGSSLSARGKEKKHTANSRAESHSPDMYHPEVLWNHSLCAQHRQGGEKRAGTRDCKLSSPLLSEDKNDLPLQGSSNRSTYWQIWFVSCYLDTLSRQFFNGILAASPLPEKTKTAQKTNPMNKHDLLSAKTKSTRMRNGHHSTKSKFESCLFLSKDCGFISWAVEDPKLRKAHQS